MILFNHFFIINFNQINFNNNFLIFNNYKFIKNNYYKNFKNNFFFFFFNNFLFDFYLIFNINFNNFLFNFYLIFKKTFGNGYNSIKGFFLILILDASITDDEPIWEPLEWSLIQTWIFFIFLFAWIAENLITSRYGSYTGRDKRVWLGWYRTFWLIELWYIICYGAAALFIIVPFYYELTYNISFVFSWWNWYNRSFFFKFIFLYTIVIYISYLVQLNIKWMNWKKNFYLILIINLFIGYLLYINFIISFFAYFTDPLWYQKTRIIDYIQLSHEPLKWGWGSNKRDHFSYHKVSTVFWFKNDGPFAGAFLMLNLFFLLSIFFLWIYWIVLIRKIYFTKEITYTYYTFSLSSLKQFLFLFLLYFILIIFSFIINYWRFPIEFLWIINANSWFYIFFSIIIYFIKI